MTATSTRGREAPAEERKGRIAWPKMHEESWEQFGGDMDNLLQEALQGLVERKLQTLLTIVYAVGKDIFCIESKSTQRAQLHLHLIEDR